MSDKLDKLLKQLVNLHPKYIDLSLERLTILLKKIGNPHLNLPPVIHIAGTNGKGSTLSYLRYIMIENKLDVHAYISPHLEFFNERIILKNKTVNTTKLINTLKLIKKLNDSSPITFFEITTAAAFYLFSKTKADFLIMETGLGGRLDATNIIKKSLINIITPIGIDHQEFLGKNIIKICNEKLGIIKKNSEVVISKQKNIVMSHIRKKLKNKNNSKLFFNKDFRFIKKNDAKIIYRYKNKNIIFNTPKLNGHHQIENLSTSLAVILRLRELNYSFTYKKINKGIIETKWPGRLEEGKLGSIKVYLDGAHNIDGASQLLNFFKNKKLKIWLIIGMLNNKNINLFLRKIKPILLGVIPVAIPNEKNAYLAEEIDRVCKNLKLKSFPQNSINKANNFILKKVKPEAILVTGSLYLVGKVRKKYL